MNDLNGGDLTNQTEQIYINSEQATSSIVERAKQLVNKVVEAKGHDKPPFLPEEYARLLGIKKIVRADLGEVSGMLLRFYNGPVIKVNQNQNLARQNFSCAHEIGHILFSELKLENYLNNIEYRTFNPQARAKVRSEARERLCDAAATELLMPESIFRRYLSGFHITIHSIERLADTFKVSIRAAAIRIAEVSLEPCIALAWETLPKTNTLKLKWHVGPGIQKTSFAPVNTKISYPSSLHTAYEQDNAVKSYKSFKIGTDIKRLPIESKGFGRGENRYVVSLAFLNR